MGAGHVSPSKTSAGSSLVVAETKMNADILKLLITKYEIKQSYTQISLCTFYHLVFVLKAVIKNIEQMVYLFLFTPKTGKRPLFYFL